MTKFTWCPWVLIGVLVAGCSTKPAPAADVTASVRAGLDSRGLPQVSISQDRDKGIVTLSGKVANEQEKATAASVAQSAAPGQLVANELIVTPPGMEHDAVAIHDALDDAIDSNLKALLIGMKAWDDVRYSVKAGVVSLTGDVSSQAMREDVEKAAARIANVKQVVNELQVKDQKATTRKGDH